MKAIMAALIPFMYFQADLWAIFEKIPFESRYVESEQASFYLPQLTPEVKRLEGKKVKVTGYYLPVDYSKEAIVVSRYPMATCFFCGEAGPESVMLVYPAGPLSGLRIDEKVTFEGILELNDSDIYQLSFILREARRL